LMLALPTVRGSFSLVNGRFRFSTKILRSSRRSPRYGLSPGSSSCRFLHTCLTSVSSRLTVRRSPENCSCRSSPESSGRVFLDREVWFARSRRYLLLTRMAGCIQHYIPVSRQLSGISLAKIAWKPLLAASCMATYFLLVRAKQAFWRESPRHNLRCHVACSGYFGLRQHSRIQGQTLLHVVGSAPGTQEEVAHDRIVCRADQQESGLEYRPPDGISHSRDCVGSVEGDHTD